MSIVEAKQKRRFLNKSEKAEILTLIAERVKAGESKYDAAYALAGLYWQNVYRWIEKDIDLWRIFTDEPYPYGDRLPEDRNHKHVKTFTWDEVISKLKQGHTVCPFESMLYRYKIESGRLVEYRKSLTGNEWYPSYEISIPERAYKTWKFEIVEHEHS